MNGAEPTWEPLRAECPFCGGTHLSFYADVLEALVMECREARDPNHELGSVESWVDRETFPITVEMVAFAGGCGGS